MSRDYIRRIFVNEWKWSWKIPARVQLQKYTKQNIRQYIAWMKLINKLSWPRLKFLDESHFKGRGTYIHKRKYTLFTQWVKLLILKHITYRPLSPEGTCTKRWKVTAHRQGFTWQSLFSDSLNWSNSSWRSFSLRLPFSIEYPIRLWSIYIILVRREKAGEVRSLNSFRPSIYNCFRGDYLILDNASVHKGIKVTPLLDELLAEVGVRVLFLPKYSPEFNPCELVFSKVKGYLRNYRDPASDLIKEIMKGMATVTYDNLLQYYKRCTVIE